MGLSQSRLLSIVLEEIEKTDNLLSFQKKSSVKKLKTNTVHAGYAKPIFNVFFMKNMCCIGIETFLLSSSICYVIDVFYFSFIFFPIESSILT